MYIGGMVEWYTAGRHGYIMRGIQCMIVKGQLAM